MRLMTTRWTLLGLSLVACVVALAPSDASACSGGSQAAGGHDHGVGASNATYYTCPMPEHSDVRSDQPGTCPRCGMKLVAKSTTDSAPTPTTKATGEEQHQHAH